MDKNILIQALLDRGVENILPNREFVENLLKQDKKLTIYAGFDPTASTLHVGHAVLFLKLREFQRLGHKVIFLIGDFTAKIGDPTDKSSARVRLTDEEIQENLKLYTHQASQILDFEGENKAEVKFNSEWLSKLNFADILELSSNFTVQRMMERDMFQKRLEEEKPIYMHEFFYPLMQGYDSVAMMVDGEIGGNDQTFNMLAGRHLMKNLQNKEKFVISMKLLVTDKSGLKMSKSLGNFVALNDTPEDMFGKVMNFSDECLLNAFEICTFKTPEEIREYEKRLEAGENPRNIKLELAYEITKIFLGSAKYAEQGRKYFEDVIQNKEKPEEMKEIKPSEYNLCALLKEAGLVSSNSEVRRLVEQGGVKINDISAKDINDVVKNGDIVQKGKLNFVKVI